MTYKFTNPFYYYYYNSHTGKKNWLSDTLILMVEYSISVKCPRGVKLCKITV